MYFDVMWAIQVAMQPHMIGHVTIVFIFFQSQLTITWSGDLPCDVVFCVPTIVLVQNDVHIRSPFFWQINGLKFL